MACFTNIKNIERKITYHEFNEGDLLCNILDEIDCVSVSGRSIAINMKDYPKIYVKQ